MSARVHAAPAPASHVSAGSRLLGLGSVFGKTIRDSRRATIVVAAIVGLIYLAAGQVMKTQYATQEGRQELVNLVNTVPPVLQGMAGRPVAVDTLGGFMNYKYGVFFPLVAGLWSILALSSTLAAESRRGSLELVATAPMARRAIAVQKVLAHVTMLAIAMAVVFVTTALAGVAFAQLPADRISIAAAFGNAVWLGLMALIAGATAFVLAQFFGRAAGAGLGGAVMFAGFVLNGYQDAIPAFRPLAGLSWFDWTRNHIPLAGQSDWPSLGLVAIVIVALFALGIEVFSRRDIGATSRLPLPSFPRPLLGLGRPATRAASDQLPTALAWGIGLAIFGFAIGTSARSFAESLTTSPELLRLLDSVFRGTSAASSGGVLQLLYVQFGFVLMGLAAATLVGIWASDETSGRLDVLLSTPLARVRWALAGGVSVVASLAVIALLGAIGIAVGVASTGEDPMTPVAGSAALLLFGAAMGGVGLAVGGILGASRAAPATAILTLATWFGEVLARDLNLPDILHQFALTAHMGMPMVGIWDGPGIAACLVIAVGGAAVAARGVSRRDVAR